MALALDFRRESKLVLMDVFSQIRDHHSFRYSAAFVASCSREVSAVCGR